MLFFQQATFSGERVMHRRPISQLMAGSTLVTFSFNAQVAKQCADNVARETGWARANSLFAS